MPSLDAPPFIANVETVQLRSHGDVRGQLIALQHPDNVPFEVRRAYFIYETAEGVVRGKHAHKTLRQLLICVSGSCVVDTETAQGERQSTVLSDPQKGLLIEGTVWRVMRNFSANAVLLVLADQVYDEEDYIRDYQEFVRHAEKSVSRGVVVA